MAEWLIHDTSGQGGGLKRGEKQKEKCSYTQFSQNDSVHLIWSTRFGGGWWFAVGGDWRLEAGNWQLVAVGGGWRRLVWLVVFGSGWRLLVGGGWRLAVPWGGP